MDDLSIQSDPEQLRRNLAITLGSQPQQLGGLRQPAAPQGAPPPDISMPTGSSAPNLAIQGPKVAYGGRGSIAGDKADRARQISTGAGVDQIYNKVTGSEFGQHHQVLGKILGGLGQGIAKAGDIGLSAVAPALAINIPGTEYHHQAGIHALDRQIGAEEGEAGKEAQTTAVQEEGPLRRAQAQEETVKAADQPALDQATIADHNAQASALLHPQAKTDFEAWQQQNPGQPIEEWLKAKSLDKSQHPDSPEQQFIDEFQKNHPNGSIADAVHAYAASTQKPEQPQRALMMVPDGKGGYTATEVMPGQSIAPGAMTAAGLSGGNAAASKETTKEQKAAKSLVDNAETAHMLAKEAEAGNAPADVDLALAFFKAIKGADGSGIRFTQQEQTLIRGSRSTSGDLEAMAQKVIGQGQMFTKDQRDKILRVMDLHAEQARHHLGDSASGAKEGDSKTNSAGDKIVYKGGKWQPQ